MSAVALQVARTEIADYLLLKKIAKGGMGTVYKGQHRSSGRTVAVKVVDEKVFGDRELGLRFARECQVTQRLDHPNLVRVLDYGMDGLRAYLVMEYVEGETLGQRLQRVGRLAEKEALPLITQVGQALEFVHQRQLVHRDVKPDNILITGDGTAKLSDLGMVKDPASDANLTQAIFILGTPNFMSPEQFRDAHHATAQSDLYSLAATLYMTVSGAVPFQAGPREGMVAVVSRKLGNDIPAPGQLVPGLSKHINDAILRGLRSEPKERQASVLEFLRELGGDPAKDSCAKHPCPSSAATAAPPGAERRRARRFPTERTASCRPVERAMAERWAGKIVDISRTGLCIQLRRRFEPGAVLTLLLKGDNGLCREILVQVVWARKNSARTWRIGGKFDQPLCGLEIDELLNGNGRLVE